MRRVLILQVSAAGRLLGVGGVPVADDSMPRQCRQVWGQSKGLSVGICVIKRSAQYLSLRRSFEGKPDNNRPTRRDGVGQKIRAACCPEKVGSSGFDLCGASEDLVSVEVSHRGRIPRRRPRASLQRAVCTSLVFPA